MEMIAKLSALLCSALSVSLSINHDKPLTALCVSHCVLPQKKKKKKRLRECREEIERVTQQVWQNGRRAAFSPHAPKAEQGISFIRLIKFPRPGFGENSVGR